MSAVVPAADSILASRLLVPAGRVPNRAEPHLVSRPRR